MNQKYKSTADAMRQLVEMAVCCGRNWQNPQTGFIQYCYNMLDEEMHATAPLYENFLFALSLMRSRVADNITEAKGFVDRLLNFQQQTGPSAGNFPIYLHEYSICKDRLLGVHVLSPLYWIYKNFHPVVGAELKAKLETSMLALVRYCLGAHAEKPAPSHLAWKIGAGAKAIGDMLQDKAMASAGEGMIAALQAKWEETSLCSPTQLADLLVAFQMIYPSISQALPTNVWTHIVACWHMPTSSYCGPGWQVHQRKNEPQTTLFDYFMGYFSECYNYRGFLDHPVQLQAALVHPSEDRLLSPDYPVAQGGAVAHMPWKVYQTDSLAYSHIAKRAPFVSQEKTFIPLSILWGDPDLAHTFVCQGGNVEAIDFSSDCESITLLVTLCNTIPHDQKEKRQELCFYFDDGVHTKTTVNGQSATTFQIEDSVQVEDDRLKIGLGFELVEGEGRFFGHLMKGNRPAQTALVGKCRFDAYDWQLFLRSVERTAHCVIRVTLRLQHPTG